MKLEQLLADVYSIPPDSITDDLAFQGIESWDSMTHMMMVMQLEEGFQIQLTGDEIADMRTVGDARKAIIAHGGAL